MATMSTAPTGTALTPPSSSHGTGYSWNSSSFRAEAPKGEKKAGRNGPVGTASIPPDGPLGPANADSDTYVTTGGIAGARSSANTMDRSSQEAAYMSPPYRRDGGARNKDSTVATESPSDPAENTLENEPIDKRKRTISSNAFTPGVDDDSKWIHRDKLARIESEELQAAGIVLPSTRTRGKPLRGSTLEKVNGHKAAEEEAEQPQPARPLKAMTSGEDLDAPEPTTPSWDLRLPEEIAMESPSYFTPVAGGANGGSRIPVAKTSPMPIPNDFLERDAPKLRRRESTPKEEGASISYPKTRSRSGSAGARTALEKTPSGGAGVQAKRSMSDLSPKKSAGSTTGRKTSAPAKTAGPNGRQKTRGGPSKDSTSSSGGQTRPSTRSGELKAPPEGEPPWMVSAYRPDPRLPPDQQLLPTVAKRLQQEKWEREGKFGNVYDKEFRPLTDEGMPDPPPEEPEPSKPDEKDRPAEWPLTSPALSPPDSRGRTGAYSTIPKIQEKPNMSPLPSPRNPQLQQMSPLHAEPARQEAEDSKKGCGCCVVM